MLCHTIRLLSKFHSEWWGPGRMGESDTKTGAFALPLSWLKRIIEPVLTFKSLKELFELGVPHNAWSSDNTIQTRITLPGMLDVGVHDATIRTRIKIWKLWVKFCRSIGVAYFPPTMTMAIRFVPYMLNDVKARAQKAYLPMEPLKGFTGTFNAVLMTNAKELFSKQQTSAIMAQARQAAALDRMEQGYVAPIPHTIDVGFFREAAKWLAKQCQQPRNRRHPDQATAHQFLTLMLSIQLQTGLRFADLKTLTLEKFQEHFEGTKLPQAIEFSHFWTKGNRIAKNYRGQERRLFHFEEAWSPIGIIANLKGKGMNEGPICRKLAYKTRAENTPMLVGIKQPMKLMESRNYAAALKYALTESGAPPIVVKQCTAASVRASVTSGLTSHDPHMGVAMSFGDWRNQDTIKHYARVPEERQRESIMAVLSPKIDTGSHVSLNRTPVTPCPKSRARRPRERVGRIPKRRNLSSESSSDAVLKPTTSGTATSDLSEFTSEIRFILGSSSEEIILDRSERPRRNTLGRRKLPTRNRVKTRASQV